MEGKDSPLPTDRGVRASALSFLRSTFEPPRGELMVKAGPHPRRKHAPVEGIRASRKGSTFKKGRSQMQEPSQERR